MREQVGLEYENFKSEMVFLSGKSYRDGETCDG